MRRITFIIMFTLLFCVTSKVQGQVAPEGYEYVDSVVFRPTASVDPELDGKSIFSVIPSYSSGDDVQVEVIQSKEIADAMDRHIANNGKKVLSGYRIRIFFDNKQNSRVESEEILHRFQSMHPGIAAYRSYSNPFFKVTVGDFRTKSEALQVLGVLVGEYPAAFVVKENISFPVVDKEDSFIADTISVLKPLLSGDQVAL